MKKNKILLFSPNITMNSFHGQTFIKTRIEEYKKNGFEVNILTLGKKKIIKRNKYSKFLIFKNYEEIQIFLNENIANYKYFFIHFITYKLIKIIRAYKDINICIWIHGIEAQKWYWYNFDIFLKPIWFFKHIIYNIFQLYFLKKFISSNEQNIKIIFNSRWMKKIFLKDLGITKIKNKFAIIPNPVDESFFKKFNRVKKKNLNVLIIKNFSSYKYAGDITINYLIKLSKFKIFNNLNITLIGKGKILDKKINILKKLHNLKINNRFIDNRKLLKYHQANDIFLYLTRMDAQSVTLSEALASGLIVISSNNTAIPEFINHYKNGFLIKSFENFYKIINDLNNNSKLFNKISKKAINSSFYLKSDYVFKKEKKFLKF